MLTNSRMNKLLATMVACLATAGIASTAQAGDKDQSGARYSDVVVHYSDLDLNSGAGNKVLYARLSSAAERACGKEPNMRDLKRHAQYRACYQERLNGAVDKIGTRELQALHESRARRNVG